MNRYVLLLFITSILVFSNGIIFSREQPELSDLVGTAEFFPNLQAEYSSAASPQEALELIRKFLPTVDQNEHRHKLLLDMAKIEEQIGRLQDAQLHYQSAAFAPSGKRDFRALYLSALLLIEFADFEQAFLQCRHIVRESTDTELAHMARMQEARILQHQDREAEAATILHSLYEIRGQLPAEVLYGMYVLYASQPEMSDTKIKSITQQLKSRFPDSPEYGLLQEQVKRKPTAEIALGMLSVPDSLQTHDDAVSDTLIQSTEKSSSSDASDGEGKAGENKQNQKSHAIQTGSFRDAENAHYMQRELEKQGFTAMVVQADVNGSTFYRVLVPIAYGETEEEIVLQLKEKSFEGYPVY
ncbi:MAG: SPOR domain-containing protein [Spirochaetia bacterium]|nr:SPOR domain-containing protein [Spirochaetia bacterium]